MKVIKLKSIPPKKKKKVYKLLVLVEFDNSAPAVVEFTSNKKITFDDVVQYYIDVEDFDSEEDSLTLIESIEKIKI